MVDFLRRLSPRERVLLVGAVLFIGGTLIYGLIVSPLVSSQRRYHDMAVRQKENLARFREMAVEYRTTESSLKDMEKALSERQAGVSLLASMEGVARKLGLADRIASMKPFSSDLDSGMVEASVEMRMEKVDLGELTGFLKAVEESGLMARTARLRVKTRFDDPQLLDATVQVTALETR
jgi:general secretion pathway protein M